NSQYFKKNTDIYKVENSGFFGFRERFLKEKLEKRIDEILLCRRGTSALTGLGGGFQENNRV
ncbi:MAG: hypothetical protein LBQ94_13325, partial [Treponema sp.]|nr:hypothetical protein [Treponema sp.]